VHEGFGAVVERGAHLQLGCITRPAAGAVERERLRQLAGTASVSR
jgi:hypothetical protein